DANSHSSYLALGCVLEAVGIAASAEGLDVQTRLTLPHPRGSFMPLWARVTFSANGRRADPLAEVLSQRCTDRRLYLGGSRQAPVFDEIVLEARGRPDCGLFVCDQYSPELLSYLQKAETYIWRHESAHRDLMKWIRFGREEARNARD